MIFGALSENEVKKIELLLKSEGVQYKVIVDDNIIDSNNKSIKYNLRHLNSPSISTHVLAMEIKDSVLDGLSDEIKPKLQALGLTTDISTSPVELTNIANPSDLREELQKGNQRLIGTGYLLQFIVIALISFIIYLFKRFY